VLDQDLPAAVGAGQVGVVEADDPHLGDVEGERVLPSSTIRATGSRAVCRTASS
jgi:hypothetical protein